MSQRIEQLDRNFVASDAESSLRWHDARELTVCGRGWAKLALWSDRLPPHAQSAVTPAMWTLSKHSAGLNVRFITDSSRIAAKWRLRFDQLAMPHMPATGVSGVDLYLRQKSGWRWVGAGKSVDRTQMSQVLLEDHHGEHEFALWLPLYNGVDSLEIGVGRDAVLRSSAQLAGQPRIVFFGTSIVQGGCASRPGMAYPAILSRRLDVETINLGFSGNGPMLLPVAKLLGEIDAPIYVIDSLPNMSPQQVVDVGTGFVRALRQLRPESHIVLVENIVYQNTLDPGGITRHGEKNRELCRVYEGLLRDDIRRLHYVPCDDLLGDDWEATVDGTHLTDLGFDRISRALEPLLRQLLSDA